MRRRLLLGASAAVCLAVSAGSFLLAADIAGWRRALREGDVRYLHDPGRAGLWRPAQRLPGSPAARLLGVGDDVAFRRALQAARLALPGQGVLSDPQVLLRRDRAQEMLQAVAYSDDDPGRRSRALGLLGVLELAAALTEVRDRSSLLRQAVASFQAAIALDPENDEAKVNLELALQRGRGLQAAEGAGGPNPSPGGRGAKGAGAGTPGSGY